ncbi:HNH endonuclease signature motif containing protein [Roseovarius sp. SK2]|uniref:HNH endonuclease signature motif containing protein n=1 Tax=Roseovarius TaxID=74030 RepID=UPI00237A45A7|nr:HNH endonuclease signature motif containing protein [Roseovarius sp. SK2]MDD9727198.1 HNH endonuclease signature motif containing protein [Roseovarius sp. SK2]
MTDLTPDILRKFLRYEPDTGKLFWRERTPEDFTDGKQSKESKCASWNSQHSGKEAFLNMKKDGHLNGNVRRRSLQAHRVAWAIYYGRWPKHHIDHINGDPADNRIKNLRDVSSTQNMRNCRRFSHNSSGYNGVRWHKRGKKWIAEGCLNGRKKHLGSFDDIEDAVAARADFNKNNGFTKRHGT